MFLYEQIHFNSICMEVYVVVEYFCPGTVYICNELIEETARRRKLIFGM